jgi:NTP pyrophosphatase (non-canonical NTP hydrolase)
MDKLDHIIKEILHFRDERDWAQFHTPKNLATALGIEVGELQELMLWKTDKEVTDILATSDGRRRCTAEIADVLIFALLLCKAVGADPIEAMKAKLVENAAKYPVELAKGNATKYSRLNQKSADRKGR